MNNTEAIEVIKSMGLIIDAMSHGTRRKSIYEALNLAIKTLEDERPPKRKRQEKEQYQVNHLHDISKLRLCEKGTWLHIEGDDETYICPFCETQTYVEGDYVPKFCMECGNQLKGGNDETDRR